VEAGTGQGNQNDFCLHFGLGDHTQQIQVQIDWPDGTKTTRENLDVDRMETLAYPTATKD